MTGPQGVVEHIINFFTFGGVRRENTKPYEGFAQAMTEALIREERSTVHPYTLPNRLVVDCFGYSVIFTLPGQTHNASGPVAIEVSKGRETAVAEVDKDTFCRISTALLLRHKGRLPPTSVVLTDNNGMNLQRSNLYKVNLRGIDLSNADLTEANLTEANLSGANLHKADLRGASLKKACLQGAYLNEANLSETDLEGTNLREAHLIDANFGEAFLRNTDLRGADLRGANLFMAYIRWFDKDVADLKGADLRGAAVSLSGLQKFDLRGANLSGLFPIGFEIDGKLDLSTHYIDGGAEGRIRRVDMTGIDLSEADLSGANLSGMWLRWANLSGAKLLNTDLLGVDLTGANLSDILQKGTLLKLPKWNGDTLDTHLNHINNRTSGSLLTMMDSIDDRHADVKLRMARELMTSLQKTWANISAAALPLMDILSKPPYTDDAEINIWLGSLCERYLSRYNEQALPVNEGVFNQSVDLFTRRPALMLSHNGAFIQIIAQGMAESGTVEMKAKAAALYATYLQQEPVKPYCSLEDFGDGEGKPDWADKYTANFILLSAQPATVSAMLLSQASLEAMLRPQPDTEWHNVYLYKDGVNLSPAESPAPDELFARAFPLFNGPYQHMQNKAKFLLLVKTLNLGSLDTTFVSATRVINSEVKLVSAADQKMLKVIFAPKLTYSPESGRYGLNDLHYEELVSAYGLTSASAADKGKTLLCLAALFTKYSSVAIFGTETESPEALRHYAYALMAKAHSLDESLLKRATFTDWTNRLLGLNGAFSCTAVLSYDIVGHIRSRFPATLAGIMPPAWR